MPDGENLGEPKVAPETTTAAQETQQPTPEAPFSMPEKFKGQPPEVIARSYVEQEKLMGKVTQELGELKNEFSYLRGMVEQGAKQPEPAPPQETTPDFDWQNPSRYMDAYFEKKWQAKERELQERERTHKMREAQSNFEEGWNIALKQNPRLFAGYENEAREAVRDSFLKGIVDPYNLRKPETFEGAAVLIRHMKGTLKDVYQNAPINPVRSPATEVPTAAKPMKDEDTFDLTPELMAEAQKWGLSEKEARDAMEVGYKAWQRGELKRRS